MQEDSVRLALLEKDQENTEKEMATLREAISEISKVNVRISELLAVHQVRIEQQQQKEENINRKVETGITNLTLKMDNDRAEIYLKMDKDKTEMRDKMDTDKTEVLNEIKGIRDKVYIGVGIGLVLNILVVVFAPQIFNLFNGGLTKPQTHATILSPERV